MHRYLAQAQPYVVMGQYNQPVAMRANLSGFLESPVILYWNLEKN